jgi:DNA-3-methyladenine glycosylase
MRARRGLEAEAGLCSGPGKLTQALGIGLEMDGAALADPPFEVSAPADDIESFSVVTGPRIGITKAAERPWRFCAAGSPHVSRPRPPAWARAVQPASAAAP